MTKPPPHPTTLWATQKEVGPGKRNHVLFPGPTPYFFLHEVKGWQRPTLPHPPRCSTISANGLSFRVRKGTGRDPAAINHQHTQTTRTNHTPRWGACRVRHCTVDAKQPFKITRYKLRTTTNPKGQQIYMCVIGKLVPVTSTPYDASRSGLSTP